MSHTHDDSQKQAAWQQAWQHPFFAQGPDAWLSSTDGATLGRSFGDLGGILMCIDEGVEPNETENAVYLAGSGILFQKHSAQDPTERRKRLVAQLKDKKVTGIASHADCGACALFCREAGVDKVEETAKEWAQSLADELGVPYVGHVRPNRPEFHNALIAYYDGTGRFVDPSRAGLPAGFIISRALIDDPEHAAYELLLASKIATGDHGFGPLFTEEQPFHLALVTDPDHPELTEEVLMREMESVLAQDPRLKVVVIRQPARA